MNNPLQELFPVPTGATRNFGWPNDHADRGFIICFTGRCGSTELVDMLSQTRMCGSPDEYFNEEFIPYHNLQWQAQSLGDYFEHLVASKSTGRVFGLKIDGFRHRRLCEIIDPESLFPKKAFQYFYMTRRNLIEQAFSYARAKLTGVWHVKSDSPPPLEATSEDGNLSDKDVWHELALVLEQEFYFERFFSERRLSFKRIDYEMMCASKISLAASIMAELGCSATLIKQALSKVTQNLRKIQYGGSYQQQVVDFVCRYEDLVQHLAERRGRMPLASVRNFVLHETGIDISRN